MNPNLRGVFQQNWPIQVVHQTLIEHFAKGRESTRWRAQIRISERQECCSFSDIHHLKQIGTHTGRLPYRVEWLDGTNGSRRFQCHLCLIYLHLLGRTGTLIILCTLFDPQTYRLNLFICHGVVLPFQHTRQITCATLNQHIKGTLLATSRHNHGTVYRPLHEGLITPQVQSCFYVTFSVGRRMAIDTFIHKDRAHITLKANLRFVCTSHHYKTG